jgi:hypothetical protein
MDSTKEKDRFDAFMKLADVHFSRWKTRAQTEWKMSFALWGLMAGAIVAIKVRPEPVLLLVFLAALVVLHTAFWILQIWARNIDDGLWAFYYVRHAENILLPNVKPPPRPQGGLTLFDLRGRLWRWNNWGVWFQTLVTLGLAICVYWLVGHPPLVGHLPLIQ